MNIILTSIVILMFATLWNLSAKPLSYDEMDGSPVELVIGGGWTC